MKKKNGLLFFVLLLWGTASIASHKTISIAGTADLQGMMAPSTQSFDLDGDGTKEDVMMGGVANLATVYTQLKEENPNTVVVSVGDDLMNKFWGVVG